MGIGEAPRAWRPSTAPHRFRRRRVLGEGPRTSPAETFEGSRL
jgi:hypothetical protein